MEGRACVALVVGCVHVVWGAVTEHQDGAVDVLARYGVYQLLQQNTTTRSGRATPGFDLQPDKEIRFFLKSSETKRTLEKPWPVPQLNISKRFPSK